MKNPIGAYATIQYRDEDTPIENYYFSFGDAGIDYENDTGCDWGNDSYGVPDDNIFFYCKGGENELKSYMVTPLEGFLVRNYELVYDLEEV
jgi:hypothetical protein